MKEMIEECIKQSSKVDFLTEQWEKDRYATALIESMIWSKKVNEGNKKVKVKSLIEKYNL